MKSDQKTGDRKKNKVFNTHQWCPASIVFDVGICPIFKQLLNSC